MHERLPLNKAKTPYIRLLHALIWTAPRGGSTVGFCYLLLVGYVLQPAILKRRISGTGPFV